VGLWLRPLFSGHRWILCEVWSHRTRAGHSRLVSSSCGGRGSSRHKSRGAFRRSGTPPSLETQRQERIVNNLEQEPSSR
jgi:hypothetical protein